MPPCDTFSFPYRWLEETDDLSDIKVLVCTQHVSSNLFAQTRLHLSSIATRQNDQRSFTEESYHHDVVLQLAAADGQLQVSHGSQLVLQRGAAIIYHIFHRKVVCRGPALIVFVPGDRIRTDAGSWIYSIEGKWGHNNKTSTPFHFLLPQWELTCRH